MGTLWSRLTIRDAFRYDRMMEYQGPHEDFPGRNKVMNSSSGRIANKLKGRFRMNLRIDCVLSMNKALGSISSMPSSQK